MKENIYMNVSLNLSKWNQSVSRLLSVIISIILGDDGSQPRFLYLKHTARINATFWRLMIYTHLAHVSELLKALILQVLSYGVFITKLDFSSSNFSQ